MARLAGAFVFADIALIVGVGIWVFSAVGLNFPAIERMFTSSPLPMLVYAGWALAIFGTVAAIASIVLYGYRERWFWRCMLAASIVWLAFPPVHFVIGLISLIVLIRTRRFFPKNQDLDDPTP